MNTKITLNIGLRTYLGHELTLQQVQDVLNSCINFNFESLQCKEVLGTYQGVDEPTAVVLIEVKGIVYWGKLSKALTIMTTLLSQECIAVEVTREAYKKAWLEYHTNYGWISEVLGKAYKREDFNYEYFINF